MLICHDGAVLIQEGIARWLASFSDFVGMIVLREKKGAILGRIRREIGRTELARFLDVIAFRIYYKIFLSVKDKIWQRQKLKELFGIYPDIPKDLPILYTSSPNTKEARLFIKKLSPDIMLAACKVLLNEEIFSLPSKGTFVMHPGICPDYRNAHGCFWALANDDLDKVGMTLLRIDKGIDSGSVYGYYSYPYDELKESHIVIQHRVVLENLDRVQEKLIQIYNGIALPQDTSKRPSATWGQPWLTSYIRWRYKARQRKK